MRTPFLFLALALAACDTNKPLDDTGETNPNACVDEDADGHCWESDGDCDDSNPDVHPDAEEICDGLDNDCDGEVDEDAVGATTWYADGDGDGWGDADSSTTACTQPSGYVTADEVGDCNDDDDAVFPGADEICNDVDDDCDGITDEDDAVDAPTWYTDGDGDGYGDPKAGTVACEAPSDHVADDTDCDDGDAAIFPGADEDWCNGLDDDCDGAVDEWEDEAADHGATWYADADGDGYGDADTTMVDHEDCEPPSGFITDDTDCDDSDAGVNPGADEWCDGIDTDCSGVADDDYAGDASTWYSDGDGDGYGDPSGSTAVACDQPSGFSDNDTDCEDSDASINPGASEDLCNDVDDDCDGSVDESSTEVEETWYLDADGDGYGLDSDTVDAYASCGAPTGYVADGGDCDDGDATINPGAAETCDGVDQDCDGDVDEDEATGTGSSCAGVSCLDILTEDPSAPDGTYWIDPGGSGAAFEVYCDMTADGGGWTMITNVLSISYSWTTSGSLTDDFVFDATDAELVADVSTEIRYHCEGTTGDIIDITTTDSDWTTRPYTYGDACSLGYNWYPDTSGFTYLSSHTYGTMNSTWSVSCCCRTSHLLATYSLGFSYYDWFIDDLYYVGDSNTPLCAGNQPAVFMRVYYR